MRNKGRGFTKHHRLGIILFSVIGMVLLLAACSSNSEPVQGTLTTQDFGTALRDSALDVAAPQGGTGAVVVGWTKGSLDGVNKGFDDAFIRKYDGGVVWAQQFGTRAFDSAGDVAVTRTGISYVVGQTNGALGFKVGNFDAFLRKYDANGVVQWTRQFGTTAQDVSMDVTLDNSGNIYALSDDSNTNFTIRKFNPSGTLLQTITNSTTNVSNPTALAVDSTGNIYVLTKFFTGTTDVARLFKYNSAGTLVASPTVFAGVDFTEVYDLVVDSNNNLYFSVTDNRPNRGSYVRKVNNAGATLWTANIEPETGGTSTDSVPQALALGSQGNVTVAGYTFGVYTGFTDAESSDIFVLQLNGATGARVWTRQFGGNGFDQSFGVAVSDAVYVTGFSNSNPNFVGDTNYCNCFEYDAFLAQLNPSNGAIIGIDQ